MGVTHVYIIPHELDLHYDIYIYNIYIYVFPIPRIQHFCYSNLATVWGRSLYVGNQKFFTVLPIPHFLG